MTEIDHIRPKSGRWYWWLAFQVQNVVATCRSCNNAKRDQWALPPGSRQLRPREYPWTVAEAAMLVDPTTEDPAPHLTYVCHEGVWGIAGMSERGRWTIATLELDRDSFIQEINELAVRIIVPTVRQLKEAATNADRARFDELKSELFQLSADDHHFAAFYRTAISYELRG